mgnify:CR=1 FL=1
MAKKPRIPMKGGDEYDALTKAKKWYFWKPSQRKKIKKKYNKRMRAETKETSDE